MRDDGPDDWAPYAGGTDALAREVLDDEDDDQDDLEDRSIYDDECPECGEPGLVGCDPSCLGERTREYEDAEGVP